MFRSSFFPRAILPVAFVVSLALSPRAHAWGNDGHQMINRLAVMTLPSDTPAFLRAPTALNEIEYLGPEPDRWRSSAEAELDAVQAPEHFIDLELADALGALPPRRLEFEAKAFAANQRPEKLGLQPWQAQEVWQRLKAAMREYRALQSANKDTKPVEAAIIFYCGWLGHYVGDAANPLHTTVHYNGWTGPNPNGYTTSNKIHFVFESGFVSPNIHIVDIQPKMTPAQPITGDMFTAYVAYLRHSFTFVEKVYQLEKAGGFEGSGTAESRAFVAERIAAGASMLRDMIYSAWIESAKPMPDPYAK